MVALMVAATESSLRLAFAMLALRAPSAGMARHLMDVRVAGEAWMVRLLVMLLTLPTNAVLNDIL